MRMNFLTFWFYFLRRNIRGQDFSGMYCAVLTVK